MRGKYVTQSKTAGRLRKCLTLSKAMPAAQRIGPGITIFLPRQVQLEPGLILPNGWTVVDDTTRT